jgi:hypothetical protein
MLNNIHPNINYKFNVFKKQNWTRIAAELEEEDEEEEDEEVGCSRDRTTKKGLHMYHHSSLI